MKNEEKVSVVDTLQYSTVQYSTVQYSAVQYSAVQYVTALTWCQYGTLGCSLVHRDLLLEHSCSPAAGCCLYSAIRHVITCVMYDVLCIMFHYLSKMIRNKIINQIYLHHMNIILNMSIRIKRCRILNLILTCLEIQNHLSLFIKGHADPQGMSCYILRMKPWKL